MEKVTLTLQLSEELHVRLMEVLKDPNYTIEDVVEDALLLWLDGEDDFTGDEISAKHEPDPSSDDRCFAHLVFP